MSSVEEIRGFLSECDTALSNCAPVDDHGTPSWHYEELLERAIPLIEAYADSVEEQQWDAWRAFILG